MLRQYPIPLYEKKGTHVLFCATGKIYAYYAHRSLEEPLEYRFQFYSLVQVEQRQPLPTTKLYVLYRSCDQAIQC